VYGASLLCNSHDRDPPSDYVAFLAAAACFCFRDGTARHSAADARIKQLAIIIGFELSFPRAGRRDKQQPASKQARAAPAARRGPAGGGAEKIVTSVGDRSTERSIAIDREQRVSGLAPFVKSARALSLCAARTNSSGN